MGGELAVSVDAPSGQGGEKVYTFFLPHGFKYSVVETFANRQRTTKVTHSLSASGINMHYDPSEGTTTQAVLRNHLGNMVAVLASNDTNLIDPYKISPYGLTQNGGNAKTNQLVQNKPQYDNFQIVHFGGRVYDLYSRQFLTPDPIVPNHSNITHWGRYSYGYGNPYGHVDPTGYFQIESHDSAAVDHSVENSSGDVPEGTATAEVQFDMEISQTTTFVRSHGRHHSQRIARNEVKAECEIPANCTETIISSTRQEERYEPVVGVGESSLFSIGPSIGKFPPKPWDLLAFLVDRQVEQYRVKWVDTVSYTYTRSKYNVTEYQSLPEGGFIGPVEYSIFLPDPDSWNRTVIKSERIGIESVNYVPFFER